MKKIVSIVLGITLLLTLAACGGNGDKNGQQAPDLNQYYENFMSTLGEENEPAMMDIESDLIASTYPGLESLATKQQVLKTAMISSVPYEFALVELENESDAQKAAEIFQARIDLQIENGAFYPMTVEGWQKAEIITHGNVVALICAGGEQSQAAEAFNALFTK